MKSVSIPIVLLSSIFTFGNASAGKPVDNDGNFIGNGYPSGPHYNMHFHGKGETFTCPDPQYYYVVTVDPGLGDEERCLLVDPRGGARRTERVRATLGIAGRVRGAGWVWCASGVRGGTQW